MVCFFAFEGEAGQLRQIETDLMVITPAYLERKSVLNHNVKSIQQPERYWRCQQLVVWDGVTNIECNDQLPAAKETACFLKG